MKGPCFLRRKRQFKLKEGLNDAHNPVEEIEEEEAPEEIDENKAEQELFEKRKKIVCRFNQAFKEYDFLTLPPDGDGNAWHLYLLRINQSKLNINRNQFGAELQEAGLGISMHFIPHYRYTYFKNRYGLKPEDFANAEKQYQATITLPLWPDMNDEQVEHVINAVIQTGKQHYV